MLPPAYAGRRDINRCFPACGRYARVAPGTKRGRDGHREALRPAFLAARQEDAQVPSSEGVSAEYRGSDGQELPQEWKEEPPEDRREGQAAPVRQVPQAKPEAGEDTRTLVLPGLPTRGRCLSARSRSERRAAYVDQTGRGSPLPRK